MVILPGRRKAFSGNDSYVSTLLHLDTDVSDVSGTPKKWTNYNGTITTSQSKFGGGSLVLSGTPENEEYIWTPGHSDFNFSGGIFSIDMWVRPTKISSGTAFYPLYQQYSAYNTYIYAFLSLTYVSELITQCEPFLQVKYRGDIVAEALCNSFNITTSFKHLYFGADTEHYYAAVDGDIYVTDYTTAPINYGDSNVWIGVNNLSNPYQHYNGYLDEIRISKGRCRWTADFTPPVKEYY